MTRYYDYAGAMRELELGAIVTHPALPGRHLRIYDLFSDFFPPCPASHHLGPDIPAPDLVLVPDTGADRGYTATEEDIAATDWEVLP